jgi:polyhydroxybutyrate depolymerase
MIPLERTRIGTFTLVVVFAVLGAGPALAQTKGKPQPGNGLPIRVRTIDGVKRYTREHVPPEATTRPTPLVFVFHGHFGTATDAAKQFAIHKHWPQSIVVYMKGLPTPSGFDPKGKHPGWQYLAGERGDRDVKFFDAVLRDLRRRLKVDNKRVYAAGYSNGGGMTYVLWSVRRDKLAATAVVAMTPPKKLVPTLKPMPMLLVAGKQDMLVKFEAMEKFAKTVAKLNQCTAGRPWTKKDCTLYPSKTGAPVVLHVHPGGHDVPPAAQASIVEFFKKTSK